MSSAAASRNATIEQLLLGARMCLPICISVVAYGLVWGVLAGQAGLSALEVLLMSGLLYAGASQFVALELWTPGAQPIGALVLAAAIVNLRLLLMSATLRPLFAGVPAWRGAAAMTMVSDEVWAITMSEVAKGRGSIPFFVGAGLAVYVAWLGSTLAGRLLGAAIDDPGQYGLDFAFTATFVALLLGFWRGRGDLLPWIVAAAAAVLSARLIPGNWYILIGGISGSLAGAFAETRRRHGRQS